MKKLILLVLMLPIVVMADPGAATRQLINDTVSMLDFGLFRAERDFERRVLESRRQQYKHLGSANLTGAEGGVFYLFADDLIVVRAVLKGSEPDVDTFESECKAFIEYLRIWVGVNSHDWFAHSGYQRSDRPTKLIDQIKSRIQLRCDGEPADHGFSENPIVSVRSMLLERGEVFVTKGADQ